MGGRTYVTYASHVSCRTAHRRIRQVRLRRGTPSGYRCRTYNRGWKRSSGSCRHKLDRDKYFGWYPPH